jgi:hypothetical protein
MIPTIQNTLQELSDLLQRLDGVQYRKPIASLSNATIGQHTRHIIELFVCLLQGYEAGKVNYDERKRDKEIETSTAKAIETLLFVQARIQQPDKPLLLVTEIGEEQMTIPSCYYRELLYNLEHCIHHQALIKVALCEMPYIDISENFGVAPSTVRYRALSIENEQIKTVLA